MVNLTIRLSKGSVSDGGGASSGQDEANNPSDPSITVACPEYLTLADLPVAKGVGSVSHVTLVKIVGRKARRRLGDKVHFCLRCNFPIAIYGRLDPCEHIFCLTCARRDSSCYLCEEKILRIQRVEVLEGIFICGAPRCMRSFLKKQDFQLHIKETHADLVELTVKDEPQQEVIHPKQASADSQVPSHAQALPHSPPQTSVRAQSSDTHLSRDQPKLVSSPSRKEEQQGWQKQPNILSPAVKEEQDHNQILPSPFMQQMTQSAGTSQIQQHQDQQQEVHSELPVHQQMMPFGSVSEFQDRFQYLGPIGVMPHLGPAPVTMMQENMRFLERPMIPPYQGSYGPGPMTPQIAPVPQSIGPSHFQDMGQTGPWLPPQPLAPHPHPAPAPPLPPLPKRGKYVQGTPNAGEQMDSVRRGWTDGNPNFGPPNNYGGWPAPS